MLHVWALYDRLVYKWEMEMGAAVAQRIALAATGQEGHPTTVPFCAPMSKQSEDQLSKNPLQGFAQGMKTLKTEVSYYKWEEIPQSKKLVSLIRLRPRGLTDGIP